MNGFAVHKDVELTINLSSAIEAEEARGTLDVRGVCISVEARMSGGDMCILVDAKSMSPHIRSLIASDVRAALKTWAENVPIVIRPEEVIA